MPDIDDGDIELRRVYAEAEHAVRYTPLQNIADQVRKRRVHSSNRINFVEVNRAVKILLIQQSDGILVSVTHPFQLPTNPRNYL
jgi:hypothetical protein